MYADRMEKLCEELGEIWNKFSALHTEKHRTAECESIERIQENARYDVTDFCDAIHTAQRIIQARLFRLNKKAKEYINSIP